MKPFLVKSLRRIVAVLIAGVSLISFSTGAAAVTPVVTVGDVLAFSGTNKFGNFADTYSFTLDSSGGISDISSWTNVAGTNVTGFDVALTFAGGGAIANATQTVFTGTQLQSKLEIPSLAAGTYNITFSGVGGGSLGGRFLSTVTIVAPALAVPEPESWIMLLVGVCLVGTIARRRGPFRGHSPAKIALAVDSTTPPLA